VIDQPVDAIEVATFVVPTDAPEADGTLSWSSTTLVLVRAHAGGMTGTGWTYGPHACAEIIEELLAACVLGHEALDVTAAAERMRRAVRNAGRPGAVSYAISAVDIALWDLKARLLGLALHRLIGAVHETVAVYGSGGFTTYDSGRLRDQLRFWVDEQHVPRVKIKIGEGWGTAVERDLGRIAEARTVIGPDVQLYVDANGGYQAKQAIRVAAAAAESEVSWLEEPVSSDDLDGLARVRDAVDCDVAAGEYGTDVAYFARMITAGAVDCVQADVTRCGGISEWLRIAAVAAGHNLQISGHCAPHLHAHVAAATPNARHLEWFHDHVRIENMLFTGTLDPSGGAVRPDRSAAGHGLAVRDDAAARYCAGHRRIDLHGSEREQASTPRRREPA
jgi:L-alanine-DL-glutamate epimerase-like enolase superfamily enzyme